MLVVVIRTPLFARLGLIAVAATFALAGCATRAGGDADRHARHSFSEARNAAWPLKDLAQIAAPRVLLMVEQTPAGVVDIAPMRAGWAAAERLLRVAEGKVPEIVVVAGRPANAHATYQDGAPLVAVNFGMVEMLGEDQDAWAALLGHEMAHLALSHGDKRQKRREDEETGSGLLGLALSIAGVPLGSTLADASVTLVERGYSRDDEREADRVGVEMMVRAGFDPEGAVRMQAGLGKAGGASSLPFLSTHPGGEERVAAMRELARKYSGRKEPAK